MKKAMAILFSTVFWCNLLMGQSPTQRLVVPRMGTIRADATQSVITMMAYCIDPTVWWPGIATKNAQTILPQIYYGGDDTKLSMKINGRIVNLSLAEAQARKLAVIVTNYKTVTIRIQAVKPAKLISADIKGFGAGEKKSLEDFDRNLIDKYPIAENSAEQSQIQYSLHKEIVKNKVSDPASLNRLMEEYVETKITHNPNNPLPKNWVVTREGSVVRIHELKTNVEPAAPRIAMFESRKAFSKIYHDWSLEAFFDKESLSACITLDSSMLITLSGTFKAFLPVKVEFSSDFTLKATAQIMNSPFAKEKTVYQLSISHETEILPAPHAGEEHCVIKRVFKICYPLKESSMEVELCNGKANISQAGLEFLF